MKHLKKILQSIGFAAVAVLVGFSVSHAGTLSPLAAPGATSYTLADIYNRITTGASATAGNHSLSTTTPLTASFRSLTEIYNAIPGMLSGEISNSTSTADGNGKVTITIPRGISDGLSATVSTSSTALVASNIKFGTTVFGVAGTYNAPLVWQTDPNLFLCWNGTATGCIIGTGQSGTSGNVLDPTGTGSPLLGAVEYCHYLGSNGTTVGTTPNTEGAGGASYWRLPYTAELVTAAASSYFSRSSDPSDIAHVPGGFVNGLYWSGTTGNVPGDGGNAQGLTMPPISPYIYFGRHNGYSAVRCVHDQ